MKKSILLLICTAFLCIGCNNAPKGNKGENPEQKTTTTADNTPTGIWTVYHLPDDPSLKYVMEVDNDGNMRVLKCGYYDVEEYYEGTYTATSGKNNECTLTFNLKQNGEGADFKGKAKTELSEDQLTIEWTTETPAEGFIADGDIWHACCENPALQVKSDSEKPNILDMFKTIYQFEHDYMYDKCYNLWVLNKHTEVDPDSGTIFDSGIADVKNGYLFYTGGGAPCSNIEFTLWKEDDGKHMLLGQNYLGESPDVQPTVSLRFWRYDIETRILTPIEVPFTTPGYKLDEMEYGLAFPQKGKDISFYTLSESYEIDRKMTLKWTGSGFTL